MTDKNKEQFEKWCKKLYVKNLHFRNISDVIGFDNLPFEMQIGVYLAYYDNLGKTKIIADYDVNKKDWFVWVLKDQRVRILMRDNTLERMSFNSRNEAYKEAFKQANELINQQLNE